MDPVILGEARNPTRRKDRFFARRAQNDGAPTGVTRRTDRAAADDKRETT